MKVKHKNHEIEYREDTNDWFSDEVGVQPSLAAAKKALDDHDRRDRRIDTTVLYLEEGYFSHNKPKIVKAKVGVIAESRYSRAEAFISHGKQTREKVSISSLYPLSARAELERYIELKAAAEAAERAADKFKETLPSYTVESLKKEKETAGKEGAK